MFASNKVDDPMSVLSMMVFSRLQNVPLPPVPLPAGAFGAFIPHQRTRAATGERHEKDKLKGLKTAEYIANTRI